MIKNSSDAKEISSEEVTQVILVEPDNWDDGRSFSWAPGNDGVKGGREAGACGRPRHVMFFLP